MTGGSETQPRSYSIALYGNYTPDALATSYERAFQHAGHTVIRMDTRELNKYLSPWLTNRIAHRATIESFVLRKLGAQKWNHYLLMLTHETKPDMVLILKGDFLMPDTILHWQDLGLPVIIFHPDNPFRPYPAHRPETLPNAKVATLYLIWSQSLLDRLTSGGVQRVKILSFAWDPEVHPYIASNNSDATTQVLFIGTWDRQRETLLTAIARHYNLKVFGSKYWVERTHPKSPLRNCWQGGELHGREAANAMRSASIVINVLREQNLPDGINMRTFEAPGCGAFSLSNWSSGANVLLPDGGAGAYFHDVGDCLEKIDAYLTNTQERKDLAMNAHRIVKSQHTYKNRAHEIILMYEELRDNYALGFR